MNSLNVQHSDPSGDRGIRLASGRCIDPFTLKPSDIQLADIGHGLAHQCRFGGQTIRFFSVAEHAIRVACLVPAELRLAAMLHQGANAYLGELPLLLRERFPQLEWLRQSVSLAVFARFGIGDCWPLPDRLRQADAQATAEERAGLMTEYPYVLGWAGPDLVSLRFILLTEQLLAGNHEPFEAMGRPVPVLADSFTK